MWKKRLIDQDVCGSVGIRLEDLDLKYNNKKEYPKALVLQMVIRIALRFDGSV